LGYTVSGARNGLDAVQLYVEKEEEIDMVILDMIMPKMSGVEVFEELRKINPNVSVLISSGYDMDGQGTDILSKGCKGFIKKPFTMNELSNTVRTILDER
jgi:CheY-like chemotaxis protein